MIEVNKILFTLNIIITSLFIYNSNIDKLVTCKQTGFIGILSFFFIQFNVPFKIILLIETRQWVGVAKREYPGKTT